MTRTHIVTGIDNRDPSSTILTLSNGDRVDVNPTELFQNMLENQGGGYKALVIVGDIDPLGRTEEESTLTEFVTHLSALVEFTPYESYIL